ncbi:hypothetical protein [Nonomuraea africana]|uniref:Kef-type K+ transport system membrane component KefB n=1 Tax=Nonomuraea africana TaxID=46171 RepID=A0ABR9KLH0_9ACTN|nr:hypothetical protein [Nonomuraea africana]MBE1562864.1 Kef-type K+ transport system membrane component KefB [Nonomuraea africana]
MLEILLGVLAGPVVLGWVGRHEARALALFASAGLPLIVVLTTTGVEQHAITAATAAAMVTAGVFSVTVYPLIALRLYRTADQKCEDPVA